MNKLFVHYTAYDGKNQIINSAVFDHASPFATIDDVTNLQGTIERLCGFFPGTARIIFWQRMETESTAGSSNE